MPRSGHTIMLKHFTAMQLILGMQETVTGRKSRFVNIDYVMSNAVAPTTPPATVDELYEGVRLLRDLIPLVNPQVYKYFYNMLGGAGVVDSTNLDQAGVTNGVATQMAMLHYVSDQMALPMWSGPPHPRYYIMREVVSELLAD